MHMALKRLHERRANADSCATCGAGDLLATSCCAIAEERLAYPERVVPPFHCLLVAVYPLFGHVATHVFTAEKVENRENLGH